MNNIENNQFASDYFMDKDIFSSKTAHLGIIVYFLSQLLL
jgi:hypothetical protein